MSQLVVIIVIAAAVIAAAAVFIIDIGVGDGRVIIISAAVFIVGGIVDIVGAGCVLYLLLHRKGIVAVHSMSP